LGGEKKVYQRRGEEEGKKEERIGKRDTKNHLVIYCLFSSVTTDNSSSSGYPLIITHNW
jgi:hypothetical protein